MEDARKLRERADRYRCLLRDVTDAEFANSLRALIAACEAQAAERLREEKGIFFPAPAEKTV
jgi:hypothetical protein